VAGTKDTSFMDMVKPVLLPKRDIFGPQAGHSLLFAESGGLQKFFSKDSLHLEKNCCKASETFGEKSLIVSSAIPA
jgi:hypothetical protein